MARRKRKRHKMTIPVYPTKQDAEWKLNVLGSPTDGWYEISLVRGNDKSLTSWGQFCENKLLISHSGYNTDSMYIHKIIWGGLLELARQAADALNGTRITESEIKAGRLPRATPGRVLLQYRKLTKTEQERILGYIQRSQGYSLAETT